MSPNGNSEAIEMDYANELQSDQAKSRAAEKPPAESAVDTAQQIKRIKRIYDLIKIGTAASIAGAIITILIMNGQMIFGNIMRASLVPKLEIWELIIIGIVDLILVLALVSLLIVPIFQFSAIIYACKISPTTEAICEFFKNIIL